MLTTAYCTPVGGPVQLNNVSPQIIGGFNASIGQFPHQLSLLFQHTDGYWYHTCGAVLIGPNKALTAAHCTYKR